MKSLFIIICVLAALQACKPRKSANTDVIIDSGQMPALSADKAGNNYLVFGRGDSILCSVGTKNGSFSAASLVGILPGLAASHMRGPQVAVCGSALLVIACNNAGDIFSFRRTAAGQWSPGGRVNDADTIAKENLVALSADENGAFAVWLDLRNNRRNKLYGSRSTDGGRNWQRNVLVYASPDSSVCECCKPSVAVEGKNVYVMFRNWLNGNRDMYVIQSTDGGSSFGTARMLGSKHWKLDACPMDGGGLVMNASKQVRATWRSEGTIYAGVPGTPGATIGQGQGCTIARMGDGEVYAWKEDGHIVLLDPKGGKRVLGTGSQPVMQALDDTRLLCIWENEHKIHATILEI